VFAVEVYGKRKLALISSVGTLLSTVALAMIVWNADAADAKLRYAYLTVGLLSYVVFFAQGLGSIPLAVLFDTDHRKVNEYGGAYRNPRRGTWRARVRCELYEVKAN